MKQGETTWLAENSHSSPAITQTLRAVKAVHWMRSIAFVLYALRPFINHMMYFVLPESSCILLKIKCHSFQAFWHYFLSLIFLPLLKYHSPLCTLASNTALFHSFQSLANVLGTKGHFTFYINSVCVSYIHDDFVSPTSSQVYSLLH